MLKTILRIFFLLIFFSLLDAADVRVGADVLFDEVKYHAQLTGKRIGLITNQTAINHQFQTTFELLRPYQLVALFTPEHGFYGDVYAEEKIADTHFDGVVVHSLYGKTRRPTSEMLKNIDLLIYDIQDIGSRSYTYISTLFYCMEEAAIRNIPIMVLDRPNPLGGNLVDGPGLEEKWRSFVGYIDVPYCHGMTVGELAQFFNEEYGVYADLTVVPMKGWRRAMTFKETKLPWIPTSPHIPEADTAFFYPMTGVLGELSMMNIGVGYTLPFKIVGAPWINAEKLAASLNAQKLPGVVFSPMHFRPFFGKFKQEKCQGVQIIITDFSSALPVTVQYTILGMLKYHYEKEVMLGFQTLIASKTRKEMFNKLNGTEKILEIITEQKFFVWKLRDYFRKEREEFLLRRKKYLIPSYTISGN